MVAVIYAQNSLYKNATEIEIYFPFELPEN